MGGKPQLHHAFGQHKAGPRILFHWVKGEGSSARQRIGGRDDDWTAWPFISSRDVQGMQALHESHSVFLCAGQDIECSGGGIYYRGPDDSHVAMKILAVATARPR